MILRQQKWFFRIQFLFLMVATLGILQACSDTTSQEESLIKIDGSSTVHPINEKIAEMFNRENSEAKIEVNFSGTGGGFKKFCDGQTQITGASRPIVVEEMMACDQNKVRFIELPIAFDALTVVVNSENNWASDITIEELRKIWSPEAKNKIERWNQVRSSWPDRPLTLYGPGQDSGTFDYFTEAVVGKSGASRDDYVYHEDDEALVNGVSQDTNAMGYFGYAYYEQNQDKLNALSVDSGQGSVFPSQTTVKTAEYQPLSRPLFIYINAKSAQENEKLRDFVKFYLDQAPKIVNQVGYVPLPDDGYYLDRIHFERGKVGTVFDGKAEFNLTIGELLRKRGKF